MFTFSPTPMLTASIPKWFVKFIATVTCLQRVNLICAGCRGGLSVSGVGKPMTKISSARSSFVFCGIVIVS